MTQKRKGPLFRYLWPWEIWRNPWQKTLEVSLPSHRGIRVGGQSCFSVMSLTSMTISKPHCFVAGRVDTLKSTAVKSPVSPLNKAVYLKNDCQIQRDHARDIRYWDTLLQFWKKGHGYQDIKGSGTQNSQANTHKVRIYRNEGEPSLWCVDHITRSRIQNWVRKGF